MLYEGARTDPLQRLPTKGRTPILYYFGMSVHVSMYRAIQKADSEFKIYYGYQQWKDKIFVFVSINI